MAGDAVAGVPVGLSFMKALAWALAGLLLGTAPPPQADLRVPFVRQEKYLCAASCLAMVRLYWGETVTQYEIAGKAGWTEGRGLTVGSIQTYLDTLDGYRYRMGAGDIGLLKGWLEQGCPVIVALAGSSSDIQHAVVLTGFDQRGFVFHDPGRGEGMRLKFERMAKRWKAGGFFYCLLVPKTGPARSVSPSPSADPGR